MLDSIRGGNMKLKKSLIPVLLLGFIISVALSPSIATAQKNRKVKKEKKVEEKFIIPKEVRFVLQQGLVQRQGRQDIPFSIIKHLYFPVFPTLEKIHSVFFFTMMNADLGFMPQAFSVVQETKEEKKKAAPPSKTETPSLQLQASLNVFLQFHHLKDKELEEVFKEVYIPVNLQAESTTYDPEKEEIYSAPYQLPPGDYLLAMAVTSLDLQKIGTFYYEFSLPEMQSIAKKLEATPIFFIKKIKQMPSPETTAEVHKGFFTYSVFQIEPKIENEFSTGENLDILFFILGAKPNEESKFEIEVSYKILKDGESVIPYRPTTHNVPLVSTTLPLKKLVLIKKEGEEDRKESRDLEPGLYTFYLKITDKISGKSLTKNIDIEVK